MYFKIGVLTFRNMHRKTDFFLIKLQASRPETRHFSGQGRFRGIRAPQRTFFQKRMKKKPTGKNFGAFSPRYSQNYVFNEKFNFKMDTIRTIFPKSGKPPSFPLVARLIVVMSQFPPTSISKKS